MADESQATFTCTICGERRTGPMLVHVHPAAERSSYATRPTKALDPASGHGIVVDTSGAVTDIVCERCRPGYDQRSQGDSR